MGRYEFDLPCVWEGGKVLWAQRNFPGSDMPEVLTGHVWGVGVPSTLKILAASPTSPKESLNSRARALGLLSLSSVSNGSNDSSLLLSLSFESDWSSRCEW
jgi:hypothetical protein